MIEDTELTTQSERVDRFGMFASSICALHCAVCALVPAAFVTLGLDVMLDHRFEWMLTLLAVAFGVIAMVMGWRKHRKLRVMTTLAVGIIGLLAVRLSAGHGDHEDHTERASHAAHDEHHDQHANKVHPGQHADKAHHGKHADKAHHGKHSEKARHGKHADKGSADDSHREGTDTHGDEGAHDHHDHGSGEGLGIFAGLILLMGHATNVQEMRRGRETIDGSDDCCDESNEG